MRMKAPHTHTDSLYDTEDILGKKHKEYNKVFQNGNYAAEPFWTETPMMIPERQESKSLFMWGRWNCVIATGDEIIGY